MDTQRNTWIAASRELEVVLERFATRHEWLASPEGPELEARLARHLATVRRFEPPSSMGPAPAAARDWLHVAHWNVLHGLGYERILAALRDEPALGGADLVSLNETDLGLPRTGNRDVAFDLARALGMHAAWAAMFLELHGGHRRASEVPPHTRAESLFGLALLSRFPLGVLRRVELKTPADWLFDKEGRAGSFVALVAEVLRPGAPFTAVVTHLDVHGGPPDRAAQMQQILQALPQGPVVLAGDLNTTTFRRGGWVRGVSALGSLMVGPRMLAARLRAPYHPAGAAREPLFDLLRAQGFEFEPFNDATESLDLRFADIHEVETLPRPLRRAVLAALRGVERRNAFRLDWIAARGFGAAPERPPVALPHLMRGATAASDHAPIGCGLRPTGAPPASR